VPTLPSLVTALRANAVPAPGAIEDWAQGRYNLSHLNWSEELLACTIANNYGAVAQLKQDSKELTTDIAHFSELKDYGLQLVIFNANLYIKVKK
jgi:hypothetical protein